VEGRVREADERLRAAAIVPAQHGRRERARGVAEEVVHFPLVFDGVPLASSSSRRRLSSERRVAEKKLVGGSCIWSPDTITWSARKRAGTASSRGTWLASSKITTSKALVSMGRVSETLSGLMSQTGLGSGMTSPPRPPPRPRTGL